MKKLLLTSLAAIIPITFLFAQHLNLPESVEYDPYHKRYLVSNWGTGNLVQIDSLGNQSVWLANVHCYAGLHRVDSILYVACREYGVKGFNLMTGENVLSVDIPGATNINDIISDHSGNLYCSSPNGNLIYKVNIASEQAWIFANDNLNVPNGMYFDEENNRIILVSFRMNTSIQQISLADSSVSVLCTPGLHNFDGISRDVFGNYYVSSWYSNSVYKFDGAFENPPEVFSVHNGDPADIFFDKINNVLAVPLFYTHQVEFVDVITSINELDGEGHSSGLHSLQSYPNPSHQSTNIEYTLLRETEVVIRVFNLIGQEVRTLLNEFTGVGEYFLVWDGKDSGGMEVPSGIYILSISSKNQTLEKKLIKL